MNKQDNGIIANNIAPQSKRILLSEAEALSTKRRHKNPITITDKKEAKNFFDVFFMLYAPFIYSPSMIA